MKICILIPVYNEALTIADLVRDLRSKGHEVVVIDDGSTDGSGELAREQGAYVISHEQKKGKGVSLRDGFDYVVHQGFDGVVTMDGDGQHAVTDVDSFLAKAKDFPDGIINGSRMRDCAAMPKIRYITNRMMSLIISAFCRQSIEDSQCGFRFISKRILKRIRLLSSDFQIETEVLLRASRCGFKIHSIAIQTIYQDEKSKINPFIDTFRFIFFMVKELWRTD